MPNVKCPKCGGLMELIRPLYCIGYYDNAVYLGVKCINCGFKWWIQQKKEDLMQIPSLTKNEKELVNSFLNRIEKSREAKKRKRGKRVKLEKQVQAS